MGVPARAQAVPASVPRPNSRAALWRCLSHGTGLQEHMREPAQLPLPGAPAGTTSTEGSSQSREDQSCVEPCSEHAQEQKQALESIPQCSCCSVIIPSLCPLPWPNRQVTTNTLSNPCSCHCCPPRSPGTGLGIAWPFTPFPPQHVGSYPTAFPQTRNCSEGCVQNSMEGKEICS